MGDFKKGFGEIIGTLLNALDGDADAEAIFKQAISEDLLEVIISVTTLMHVLIDKGVISIKELEENKPIVEKDLKELWIKRTVLA